MAVPSNISSLSENPTLNSPAGSEPIGNTADDYIRTAFAFIKQIADGNGITPTAALNFNAQKISNIADGTLTNDAASLGQTQTLVKNVYKLGEIKMWTGAIANIASVWGAGWHLCDGTNGTIDLRDRFIVGAGNTYTPGNTGGLASYNLSIAQLPSHNHGVNDPSHAHSVADPGHAHSVADPGHAHGMPNGGVGQAGTDNGGVTAASGPNGFGSRGAQSTNGAGTGIGIYAAATGIGIYGNYTGISIQNTGSGSSIENRPPYYALAFIQCIAIV